MTIKKKPLTTETDADTSDTFEDAEDMTTNLLSPTERDAIDNVVKLDKEIKTRQELINDQEELAKAQQKNQQAYEEAEARGNYEPPQGIKSLITLEETKGTTMDELNDFAGNVENFDENYRTHLTNKIKDAKNFQDVATIMAKIDADREYQETAIKQQDAIYRKRKSLIKLVEKYGDEKYGFTVEAWKAKILQAQTMKQVGDVEKRLKMAKESQEIYGDREKHDEKQFKELLTTWPGFKSSYMEELPSSPIRCLLMAVDWAAYQPRRSCCRRVKIINILILGIIILTLNVITFLMKLYSMALTFPTMAFVLMQHMTRLPLGEVSGKNSYGWPVKVWEKSSFTCLTMVGSLPSQQCQIRS